MHRLLNKLSTPSTFKEPKDTTQPVTLHVKSAKDFEFEKVKNFMLAKKKYNQTYWFVKNKARRTNGSDSLPISDSNRKPFAGQLNAHIEAFSSRIYRLLVGKHQPKYNVFDTTTSNSIETMCQFIPNAVGLSELCDTFSGTRVPLITAEILRDAKLGRHLAAAGAIDDPDCHGENLVFDDEGNLLKIDFDCSLYNSPDVSLEPTFVSQLLSFGPLFYIDGWENTPGLKKLKNDPIYRYDVFLVLLFFSLLNRNVFQHIIDDIAPPAIMETYKTRYHTGAELVDEFIHYAEERRTLIREQLIKNAEFKPFLESHGKQCFTEILSLIKESNAESEKKIKKFEERITLFKEHPNDFSELPEYKYLIQKTRYQHLTKSEEFIKIFEERKMAYARRLIDTNQMTESFKSILTDLKIKHQTLIHQTLLNRPPQKQFHPRTEYYEKHPSGWLKALMAKKAYAQAASLAIKLNTPHSDWAEKFYNNLKNSQNDAEHRSMLSACVVLAKMQPPVRDIQLYTILLRCSLQLAQLLTSPHQVEDKRSFADRKLEATQIIDNVINIANESISVIKDIFERELSDMARLLPILQSDILDTRFARLMHNLQTKQTSCLPHR